MEGISIRSPEKQSFISLSFPRKSFVFCYRKSFTSGSSLHLQISIHYIMARNTLDVQRESTSGHSARDSVSVEHNSLAAEVTGYKRRFEQISNKDEEHHLPSKRARPTTENHPEYSIPDLMDHARSDSNISGSTATAGEEIPDDKLEPIAIIGLSLRFPQDATSPTGLWDMLMDGRSARSDVPKDRFNVDAFYKKGSSKTGIVSYCNWLSSFSRTELTTTKAERPRGPFRKGEHRSFRRSIFHHDSSRSRVHGSTPKMVTRNSLRSTRKWQVSSHDFSCLLINILPAGLPIHKIAGSKTSVHVGAFLREYEFMICRDPQMKAKYKASGTAFAMLANRLSWFFDLMGPSTLHNLAHAPSCLFRQKLTHTFLLGVAIDTACSSSLYALDQACQSLRSGDSTMVS